MTGEKSLFKDHFLSALGKMERLVKKDTPGLHDHWRYEVRNEHSPRTTLGA